jgi:hypothetical protein
MISNEVEEREKDDIQFVEAREDAPEALEAAKEPLDFVVPLLEFSVEFPWIGAVDFGGDHWNHARIQHQLPGFAPF